jgi:glycosyltransferase involved in cell wall biosynthesis
MDAKKKMISIVTPCYNEEENIRDCYEAVREVFETRLAGYDFEHIFCDNASTDRTVAILKELAREDGRVKIIVNSRNFGPFRSTFNGLLNTKGDAVVVLLAADLQDPPALIPDFVRKWEEGYQIVYGIREKREENPVMAYARKIYYRLICRFADVDIPPDVGEFQLIDRVVVEALRGFDDYYPFIRGMIASCGFRTVGLPYDWGRRKKGFSKNRLYHLVDQGLNGLISFTNIPLRLCMFFGFFLAVLSITYAVVQLVVNLIFFRTFAPPGIATLIVGLFFFSGVQLFFLGFLGEYIGAIHFQVRKRPLVIEREKINFEKKERTSCG